MHLKIRLNGVKGFSIVELLVGMTLFCVAFVMVLGVIPNAFRSIQMTKTYLIATQIATEQLEQIAGDSFVNIKYSPTYPDNSSNYPAKTITFDTNFANGERQQLSFIYWFEITPKKLLLDVDGDGVYSLTDKDYVKEVKVTVKWEYGSGSDQYNKQERQIEMISIVSAI